MKTLQRRTLWICIFAMAFIFFYEAGGRTIFPHEDIPPILEKGALKNHFWSQLGYGLFFLAFGAVLTAVLRRPDKDKWGWADWILLALGLSVLSGALFHAGSLAGVL